MTQEDEGNENVNFCLSAIKWRKLPYSTRLCLSCAASQLTLPRQAPACPPHTNMCAIQSVWNSLLPSYNLPLIDAETLDLGNSKYVSLGWFSPARPDKHLQPFRFLPFLSSLTSIQCHPSFFLSFMPFFSLPFLFHSTPRLIGAIFLRFLFLSSPLHPWLLPSSILFIRFWQQ